MARDNTTLGRFRLEGIPTAPRGVPQIEVSFDIDANGIVNVSAKDLATGKEQRITITATTNLTPEQVEALVKEAESHAADDKRQLEEAELKNNAGSLAYQTERMLEEHGDKVEPADREAAEAAIADVRKALEDGGLEGHDA